MTSSSGLVGDGKATAMYREKRRPITVRSDVVLTVREGKDNLRVFPDIFLVGATRRARVFQCWETLKVVTHSSWPFQNGLEGTQSTRQADHVIEYRRCDQVATTTNFDCSLLITCESTRYSPSVSNSSVN